MISSASVEKIRQAICTERQMLQFKVNVVSMLGVKTQCLTKKERRSWKHHENLFLGATAILRKETTSCIMHLCLSVRLSVRMEQLGFQRRDLNEIWNLIFDFFFENLSRKFEFHLNVTRIKGTLHEDQYTFFIISHSVLLRMRNVSHKLSRENRNTFYVQ